MGLDVPDLDDRKYEEILEDAKKRIPVHAAEWSDHNVHDPGITLLELFAWLSETYGYQIDRITDEHRHKYLQLVGVEPRPPEPAEALLNVTVPDDRDGLSITTGEPLLAETAGGRSAYFQTDEAVALTAATIAAVVSIHGNERREHGTANERSGMHYNVFGPDPSAGDLLYLGFDRDPFAATERLDLWVDYHDEELPDATSNGETEVKFEPSHRLVWEHCTDPTRWRLGDAWAEVPTERDETNGFYRHGRLSLAKPDDWTGEHARLAGHDRLLVWIRCRLARREPMTADRHRSPEADAAPTPHYEIPPAFDAVMTNVLRASHRRTIRDEELRADDGRMETSGRANQTFEFAHAPVLDATVAVGDEEWTERPDFAASGPDDRHFMLGEQAGTVTFGNGRRGTIPAPGQTVTATYDHGGGTAGNVSKDARWSFMGVDRSRVTVTPRERPRGGQDAERIEDALARFQTERRDPHRAVTPDDYASLAINTPGLRFGRAAVADGGDADVVRVVVVPYSPPPGRAVPSEGFLAAVERHVRRNSLLTDRVEVVSPTYVGVRVNAGLTRGDGARSADVRTRAMGRLEAFLSPLSGFGGDGWPFGRPVRRSELYAVLEGIEGVNDVRELAVGTVGDGTIEGDQTALPYPAAIDVTVQESTDRCGRGV